MSTAPFVEHRYVAGYGTIRDVNTSKFATHCVDQWVNESKEGTPEDLIAVIEKNVKALIVQLADA